ncbi:MAG: protein-L-isoaspartate(D-aspartate) O-methyltransferase [Candidatus Tectomicrobia bacterium]|uniref:Protein-L-isoaspartate O-methyltransferase n=1 Tax=Tectimicrobiota bacterium TaxID=2528274 RepID=A0A933GME1_UNCTE|nr:protein-L-isoaspartate(D-aspartate) O-methyltransferase [Candidatus Tectomicrobia bacterium]
MNYEVVRKKMVEEQLMARGIRDERVLEAMERIPRHLFVEEALWDRAYGDHPLPIGEKQTISQPYMVALMTELLALKGTEKVLEIGTGSGYQTAVLSLLAQKVYSIERIKALGMRAREVLDKLECYNVVIRISDGTYGWSDHAPYDAITVTASSPEIPKTLVEQLKLGGIMVIPIGGTVSQVLTRVSRTTEGFSTQSVTECVFVKLIGQYGWTEQQ